MHLIEVDSSLRAAADFDSEMRLLSGFACYYPEISDWFLDKVIGGLRDGSRRIIKSERHGVLNGILIAKRDLRERKICTLWVHPGMRGTGLVHGMMEEALDWLDCTKPVLSLPQEAYCDFQSIIRRYGFKVTQVAPNYYRSGRVEYVLNGVLPKRLGGTAVQ